MKKLTFHIFVILLAILLGITGCAKKENEIKIGVILPLTGELANFGQNVFNGIKLAVEDFSNKNIRLNVNLISEDSQAQPTIAVNALNKLVDINKTNIIIGSLTSSATLAMAPIAQQRKVLLISPTASNPALSKAGEYFFRVWPSDDFNGKVAAQYCYNKLNALKAGIIYINNDYGIGLKNVFKQTFENLGGKILLIDSYNEEEMDFRTVLLKIKSANVDLIYLPGHPRGIGTFLKQAKEIGIKLNFFSDVAAEDEDFLKYSGNSATGLFFVAPSFNITSNDLKIKTFVKNYRTRFNKEPDVHSVKGYDAALVILSGIAENILTPNELKKYLHTQKIFHGISGDFNFDQNGDIVTAAAIKQYQPDGSIKVLEIIKPFLP